MFFVFLGIWNAAEYKWKKYLVLARWNRSYKRRFRRVQQYMHYSVPVMLLHIALDLFMHDLSTDLISMMNLIYYLIEVTFVRSLFIPELIWLFEVIKGCKTEILTNHNLDSLPNSIKTKWLHSNWVVDDYLCHLLYKSTHFLQEIWSFRSSNLSARKKWLVRS